MLRNLAIALSLANLCLFEVWTNLLDRSLRFFTKSPPSPNNLVAILLNVWLLAAVIWVPLSLARRSSNVVSRRTGQFVFLLVLFVAFCGILGQLLVFPSLSGIVESTVLRFVVFVVVVLTLILYPRHLLSGGATIALVLFPFVPVTFFQVGWSLTKADSTVAFFDQALAPPSPAGETPATRVVWLLFDEMDQRMTFSSRPSTVHLPEMDRLRSQAFYASNAYPPAATTFLSMPALLSGQLVSGFKPLDADELMITFAGTEEAVRWSTQPNVFSKAREAGFSSAVAGWYLPYCRMITDTLTSCSWQVLVGPLDDRGMTVPECMRSQIHTVVAEIPFAGQLGLTRRMMTQGHARLTREKHLDAYLTILHDAKKAATDPDLDLVLVHWPIPHTPGIYDRSKDDFVLGKGSNYLDNLELMDRTLGEVRRSMEDTGTWETTTVLVTSDHSWRTPMLRRQSFWTSEEAAFANRIDHRVPFLLKMAGQKEAMTYEPAFNTVLTHDLLLALLRGKVCTPNSVVSWIDQQRSIAGNPHNRKR